MIRRITSKNITAKYINKLFKKVDYFKSDQYISLWQNKTLVNAFFEPSTRTALSFETAMYRLGGNVFNYNRDISSMPKKESYSNIIQTLSNYGNILVIRHPEKEFVKEAAKYTNIPIINAGEGEHPTQSLVDLYTIHSKFKLNKEYIRILFVGNIQHTQSMIELLYLFRNYVHIKVHFLPYKGKEPTCNMLINTSMIHEQIPDDIIIDKNNCNIEEFDVIYCTQLQSEETHELCRPDFIVNKELLKNIKENAIIMHSFPRNNELYTDVYDDPRSQYLQQKQDGLYIRMAIIDNMLRGELLYQEKNN